MRINKLTLKVDNLTIIDRCYDSSIHVITEKCLKARNNETIWNFRDETRKSAIFINFREKSQKNENLSVSNSVA